MSWSGGGGRGSGGWGSGGWGGSWWGDSPSNNAAGTTTTSPQSKPTTTVTKVQTPTSTPQQNAPHNENTNTAQSTPTHDSSSEQDDASSASHTATRLPAESQETPIQEGSSGMLPSSFSTLAPVVSANPGDSTALPTSTPATSQAASREVTIIGLATGGAIFGLFVLGMLIFFLYRKKCPRTNRAVLPYATDFTPERAHNTGRAQTRPTSLSLFTASSVRRFTASIRRSQSRSSASRFNEKTDSLVPSLPPAYQSRSDTPSERSSVASMDVLHHHLFLQPVVDDWEDRRKTHLPRASFDSGNQERGPSPQVEPSFRNSRFSVV